MTEVPVAVIGKEAQEGAPRLAAGPAGDCDFDHIAQPRLEPQDPEDWVEQAEQPIERPEPKRPGT